MKANDLLREVNPELYRVVRLGGTEAPFSSPLLSLTADGILHCAVCGAALFKTDNKFDSGTGWPSFTEPVFPEAVTMHSDLSHGMVRTEVKCAACNAHLGHVFPDGPQKSDGTRENRYCINGVCLELKKSKNDQ